MKVKTSQVLKSNWVWKQKGDGEDVAATVRKDDLDDKSGWSVATAMPSEIHVELLKKQLIPDPYIAFNEHLIQWVGDKEWIYASTFLFDKNENQEFVELVFEGLDTVCTVYLDGEPILETDNQFRTYRVDIASEKLKATNTLFLHFKSAKLLGKELEKKYGKVRAGSNNLGDPSRVYVRKAQYDWRWDWGPEIMTVGPYRPIYLETYTAHIVDLNTKARVSSDLNPSLEVALTLRGNLTLVQDAQVVLKSLDGKILKQEQVTMNVIKNREEKTVVKWDLKDVVELWWPIGYGTPTMYTVEVVITGQNSFILDSQTKNVGFRRVRLIQEPLAEADQYGKGTTFLFEVNNIRIFMGGSNWVPADNFLTTVTPERYRKWLQMLVDGNQNIIRLWGGGIYEPDLFYDMCDELGLLVWQDFQFACGVYPAYPEFVESVRLEAIDNVKRLRHHPSMALLCGNNEDYQQVLQWGGINALPARIIYEETLPKVVTDLTEDDIPYWRGSPYGGKDWDTADPTIGDVHQWNVWASDRTYHDYDILGGRFVSEFGMPSFPDKRTIDYWSQGTDPKLQYSQSKLMAQHDKGGSHEKRFAIHMNENFRLTDDFETHAYYTQILQSDAVGWAYRAWRRAWKGRGKEYTAGTIVWQINDSWPVTSWAIVDYFYRPKPAYFTIARELSPISVGITRTVHKNRPHDRPRQFYEFGAYQSLGATIEVWGTNSTLKEREAILELRCVDLASDWTHEESHHVVLLPNQSTEILSVPCPEPPAPTAADAFGYKPATSSHTVVVGARLVDAVTKELLSRFADFPQPYRYVDFPDPGLKVTVQGEKVRVEVKKPAKGVVLSVDGEKEVKWSNNGLDVMPDDPQEIDVKGLDGRPLKVMYMGGRPMSFQS